MFYNAPSNHMSDSGSIVISLDAELAWGYHDLDRLPTERARTARDSWMYLLDLFERWDLPSTWALVGQLFPEASAGRRETHPAGEEWFPDDLGDRHDRDSIWFGGDLIDAILDSAVDHEIGSHSFSHVEFGNPETTPQIAEAELKHSREIASEYGLAPTSFLFPRHSIGHRELLRKYGFRCYRGVEPERWYHGTPVQKLGTVATGGLGMGGPPIVTPEVDEFGLVNIPASLPLFGYDGFPWPLFDAVAGNTVVRQLELGLNRLKDERDGVLHLWLHPNDIVTESDREQIREILSIVGTYRNRYDIPIETMEAVTNRVRGNQASDRTKETHVEAANVDG